jgi:putative FmdB family regulatory protein
MPTYEFRCPLGHDFEKFYSRISESVSVLPCPECGQEAQRRISGGAGLLFKGSGFYLTDYGKNAHRKAAPDATPKTDSGGGSESSGGEGESASKSESGGKGESGSKGGDKGKSESGGTSASSGGSSSGGGKKE